jgi:hypothetical protein
MMLTSFVFSDPPLNVVGHASVEHAVMVAEDVYIIVVGHIGMFESLRSGRVEVRGILRSLSYAARLRMTLR